jgi:hypothetical protein
MTCEVERLAEAILRLDAWRRHRLELQKSKKQKHAAQPDSASLNSQINEGVTNEKYDSTTN